MAKYEVTYSCGHSDTVTLFGPYKERDRKLEWMKTTLCPACYKAEQARLREERNRKNAEESKTAGLAPITEGTAKQNGWAESLRAKVFKVTDPEYKRGDDDCYEPRFDFDEFDFHAKKYVEETAQIPGISEKVIPELKKKAEALSEADFEAFKKWMGSKTDPKFWIDSRTAIPEVAYQIAFLEYKFLKENGWKISSRTEADKAYWKWEFDKKFDTVPQKPEFLSGYWNGKIYSGKRIYVGGEEKMLSDAEHEALKKWIKYSAGPKPDPSKLEKAAPKGILKNLLVVKEFPEEFIEYYVDNL